MKEVTPKELREYNEKSWKETQKVFRRRLREIAKGGNCVAQYCEKEYCFGERIKPWLESIGFTVKPDRRVNWYEITWPKKDALEEFCSEAFKIFTRPMPARVFGVTRLEHLDEGREWRTDPRSFDFVCSGCGKHFEYKTPHCPNCGAKMKEEKEKEDNV